MFFFNAGIVNCSILGLLIVDHTGGVNEKKKKNEKKKRKKRKKKKKKEEEEKKKYSLFQYCMIATTNQKLMGLFYRVMIPYLFRSSNEGWSSVKHRDRKQIYERARVFEFTRKERKK